MMPLNFADDEPLLGKALLETRIDGLVTETDGIIFFSTISDEDYTAVTRYAIIMTDSTSLLHFGEGEDVNTWPKMKGKSPIAYISALPVTFSASGVSRTIRVKAFVYEELGESIEMVVGRDVLQRLNANVRFFTGGSIIKFKPR